MSSESTKNIKLLNKAHSEFIKLSTDDIAESLEKIGMKFFSELQIGTPKDTARAINGWIPTLSSAPSEWKPSKGLNNYKALPFIQSGLIKFNSIVWISNNVEYIQSLEDGHSMQAPSGFVNRALRETLFYIERETEKLKKRRYDV